MKNGQIETQELKSQSIWLIKFSKISIITMKIMQKQAKLH